MKAEGGSDGRLSFTPAPPAFRLPLTPRDGRGYHPRKFFAPFSSL
jgi:hypothetical protein